MVVVFFAGMGLPGLAGFIGEIYILLGTWQSSALGAIRAKILAVIAASGIILTAGYILWAIQRVLLGSERPEYRDIPDISTREIIIATPMALLAVALGVFPWQTVFVFIYGTIDNLLKLI